jgi:hypothetical protein
LEGKDAALPFGSGFLEVEEEGNPEAGGFEVVEALGGVFGGEVVDALEFEEEGDLDLSGEAAGFFEHER